MPTESKDLVRNGKFERTGKSNLPAAWSIASPVWKPAACTISRTPAGLLVKAPANPFAVGVVSQKLRGVQPGQAYAVEAVCETRDLPMPYRSVLVRLTWTRRGKLLHPAGMLVRGPEGDAGTLAFRDVLESNTSWTMSNSALSMPGMCSVV